MITVLYVYVDRMNCRQADRIYTANRLRRYQAPAYFADTGQAIKAHCARLGVDCRVCFRAIAKPRAGAIWRSRRSRIRKDLAKSRAGAGFSYKPRPASAFAKATADLSASGSSLQPTASSLQPPLTP
jgi:hypothetical protein